MMDPGLNNKPPIVIGGLGGSGTRVVAEIAIRLGWDMSSDLNGANDSLLFTLLFKRPFWYQCARYKPAQIDAGLEIHDRLLAGHPPRIRDWPFLLRAVRDAIRYGHDYIGSRRGSWHERAISHVLWPILRILKNCRYLSGEGRHPECWGWKEPNSHIYLESLARYYPQMRYVHVVRHGLDMAFSSNQAQLHNWGFLYGLDKVNQADARVQAGQALEYWIKANQRAVELGRRLLGDRFLLVNYDALCLNPLPVLRNLCAYLGKACSESELATLAAIPRLPDSFGRYRHRDLGMFTHEQIHAVTKLGFTVEPTLSAMSAL